MKFNEIKIREDILRGLEAMGFEDMSDIQKQAIPVILQGKDIVGLAKTGTGKTAAFGIPLVQTAAENRDAGVTGLALCPTRELAMQVCDELNKMSKFVEGIKVLPIYGGQDMGKQLSALKKNVNIVVGTPGRVMDHIRRKTLKLQSLKMLVLDEADEMLNMGFREDIEFVCSYISGEHQTELFSATMPDEIMELAGKYQNNPEFISVSKDEVTVSAIKQSYYMVKSHQKDSALCRLIDYMSPKRALIFCNTKRKVEALTLQLKKNGYSAEAIHGDFPQQQRDRIMSMFRNGNLELLLATDMVARGIDVDDVDVVFNYDLPQEKEYYVHRIGRTGRAGKKGKAVSIINTREGRKIRDLENFCNAYIKEKVMPSYDEVLPIKANDNMNKAIEYCTGKDLSNYMEYVTDRCRKENLDPMFLAAIMLRQSMGDERENIEIVSSKRDSKRHAGRNLAGRSRKRRSRYKKR